MNMKYLSIFIIFSVITLFSGCTENVSIQKTISNKIASGTSDYPSELLLQSPVLSAYRTVYLFTLNADKHVYLKKQDYPAVDEFSWPSGYYDLSAPTGVTLDVALGSGLNTDGKIWVFSLANSGLGRLYYKQQQNNVLPYFDPWKKVNLTLGYGVVEVVSTDYGLFVFTKGNYYPHKNKLYCLKVTASGSITYKRLGDEIVGKFTVEKDADGYLHVFTSTSTSVRHNRQTTLGNEQNWSGWEQIGPNAPSTIATDADIQSCINQTNGLEVFINTTDQKLYNCWQEGTGWATYWNCINGTAYPINKKFNVEKRGDGGLDLIYLPPFDYYPPPLDFYRANLHYFYQLPGSQSWIIGQRPGYNPGVFNFGGEHHLTKGHPESYTITLLYNYNSDFLQLFVPVNYYMNSGEYEYYMGYNWENTIPEPDGWVHNNTLGIFKE